MWNVGMAPAKINTSRAIGMECDVNNTGMGRQTTMHKHL